MRKPRPARGDRPRSKVIRDYAEGPRLEHPDPDGMPRTRGECPEERPCPWARCKYHLATEVTPAGSLKLVWPHLEFEQLPETCALDVADQGGVTLDVVGDLLNITRERVRQVEVRALMRCTAYRRLA